MLNSLFLSICMLIHSFVISRVRFIHVVPSRFHSYLSVLFFLPMLCSLPVTPSRFLKIVKKKKLMEFHYITHVIYSGSFLSGVMI